MKKKLAQIIFAAVFSAFIAVSAYGQDSERARIPEIRIQVRSNVAGIVRVSGGGAGASVRAPIESPSDPRTLISANGSIDITIRNILEANEVIISVEDSNGTRHQSDPIIIQRNRTQYQVTVNRNVTPAAPVAPVSPEDSFIIRQLPDNTLEIIGLSAGSGDVIFPETIHGLRVTVINLMPVDHYWQTTMWGARSIRIPDTVTRIGEMQERNSSRRPIEDAGTRGGLHQVILGNSVRTIGNYVFYFNPITEIIFPDSLVEIGIYAFSNCNLTSIILPRGLRRIGDNAFARNRGLQSVTIPAGVEFVGVNIFSENPITRATLPANLSNDIMQRYGFEEGLRNFYISQNRVAGTYVKNDPIWTRQ